MLPILECILRDAKRKLASGNPVGARKEIQEAMNLIKKSQREIEENEERFLIAMETQMNYSIAIREGVFG